jgi:LuxR family transcriptional regulator, maltose regulon positive regulatory protein
MPARRLPPRPIRIVDRERLFSLIDQARFGHALWVGAEAGAGKTSLVASYLESRRLPTVWYRLSAADRDLPTFFHYFGEAMRRAQPRRLLSLPHLTPEYLLSVPAFAKRYFATAFAALKRPSMIVLDELQGAVLGSPLCDVLRSAIEDLPPGVTVAVLSRSAPPPTFARHLAASALTLIGPDDLRFSLEEARQLADLLGCRDASFVEQCMARARGWAAGLVLLMQTHSRSRATSDLPTQRLLFDFFAVELFELEEPPVRELLLTTASLPAMTGAEAAVVSRNPAAPELLARLARENGFVYEDAARSRYEYHPLFREFLVGCAQRELPPAELERVAQEAGRVLEAGGRYEAAAEIYLGLGAWGRLSRLLLNAAPQLLAQGRWHPVSVWLAALPPEAVERSYQLLYWKGMSQIPSAPAAAREHLTRAYDLALETQDGEWLLLACCGVLEAYVTEAHDYRGSESWVERLAALLPHIPQELPMQLELRLSIAFEAVRWCATNHPLLKRWVDRAYSRLGEAPPPPLAVAFAYTVFSYDSWAGDFSRCAQLLPLARRMTQLEELPPLLRFTWWTFEVTYYCFIADFEAARRAAGSADVFTKEYGIDALLQPLLAVVRAYIELSSGDAEAAEATLALAAPNVDGTRIHASMIFFYLRMRVALARHALDDAMRQLRRVDDMLRSAAMPFAKAMFQLSAAQVWMERDQHAEAAAATEKGRHFGSHFSSAVRWISALNDAYSALRTNDEALVRKSLGEALALARAKGAVVWDIGMPPYIAARLAEAALQRGIEADYVREVVRRRRLVPDSEDAAGWPYPARLYSLGGFRLEGEAIREPGRKASHQPLALLKAVLALGGREIDATAVARYLWPRASTEARESSLKMTLHRLRRHLGAEEAVLVRDNRLSINIHICWTDVDAFERLVERGAASPGNASGQFARLAERALSLYRGSFLGTENLPGAQARRERLRQQLYRLVSEAGRDQEEHAQWHSAEQLYRRGLEVEPLCEAFYRQLIVCLKHQGRHAEALDAYYRCREVLKHELGAVPSPDVRLLIDFVAGENGAA